MTKEKTPDDVPISSLQRARGDAPMLSTHFTREILAVLLDYLSAPNCRAVIRICETIAEAEAGRLGHHHLPGLLVGVERALGDFDVSDAFRAACLERLRTLGERTLADVDGGEAIRVPIERPEDILHARRACRHACRRIGFSDVVETQIVTALSELFRFILERAGGGYLTIRRLRGELDGIELTASTSKSALAELSMALKEENDGRSKSRVELLSAHRLMDYLEVASEKDKGTTLIARKNLKE